MADADSVTTMVDVLNDQIQLEQDAKRALEQAQCSRASDAPRPVHQQIFSCLTCLDAHGVPIGLCKGCALKCHGHHQIVDLGRKMFVCDCGTSRVKDVSGSPEAAVTECEFTRKEPSASLPPFSASNKYNQNFEGKFCMCHGPYEESSDTMFQCCACEDWYHQEHMLGLPKAPGFPDAFDDFVCTQCTTKMPFLFGVARKPSGAPTSSTVQFGQECITCGIAGETGGVPGGAVIACLDCAAATHKAAGHMVGPVIVAPFACVTCAAPAAACPPAADNRASGQGSNNVVTPDVTAPLSSESAGAPPTEALPSTSPPCTTPTVLACSARSGVSDAAAAAVARPGVSMFVPAAAWQHTCQCPACTANFEAFHVAHLLAPRGEDEDEEEDDGADSGDETAAAAAPTHVNTDTAAAVASAATAAGAVPPPPADGSGDLVPAPTAASGSSPVGSSPMGELEAAGLAALSQLPPTAQLNALLKFNSFSEKIRDFLKDFADQGKVVTAADIREFMNGLATRKRARSLSR